MPNRDKCRTCMYNSPKCDELYAKSPTSHSKTDALCWCCRKSTDGTCQYMATGTPYEGSEFRRRRFADGSNGCHIISCPYFDRG